MKYVSYPSKIFSEAAIRATLNYKQILRVLNFGGPLKKSTEKSKSSNSHRKNTEMEKTNKNRLSFDYTQNKTIEWNYYTFIKRSFSLTVTVLHVQEISVQLS